MEITEVRIKLMDDTSDRLRAFCSITFDDCFVVRDLKIIEGTNGPFVAMPSRKLTAHCPQCGCKNHLRSAHCNQCSARLKDDLAVKDQEGRAKHAPAVGPAREPSREMHVQPAEPGPRPPHKPPSHRPAEKSSHAPKDTGFGEGIFE